MNLAFFCVWEDADSGLTEIIPLICTSALWSQDPVFLHPESPPGAPLGVGVGGDGCSGWWLIGCNLFLPWVPSRLTVGAAGDWRLLHPLFTDKAGNTLSFTTPLHPATAIDYCSLLWPWCALHPQTYLSDNWKFVLFEQHLPIHHHHHPSSDPGHYQSTLYFSELGLFRRHI